MKTLPSCNFVGDGKYHSERCVILFTQGNQENRSVILNNKIIDYVNFILRLGRFEGCDPDQVISLKMAIGTLLKSLIEENSPEAYKVAKVQMYE